METKQEKIITFIGIAFKQGAGAGKFLQENPTLLNIKHESKEKECERKPVFRRIEIK